MTCSRWSCSPARCHSRSVAGRAPALVAAVAAAAVKLTLGLALPFILIGARRRGAAARGAMLAIVAIGVPTLVLFGWHFFDQLHRIVSDNQFDIAFSAPDRLAALLGQHIGPFVRAACTAGAGLAAVLAIVAAWRGADPIAAAGWAFLALLASIASLAPWYLVWLLPFAAVARSRPLWIAALLATLYLVAVHMPALGRPTLAFGGRRGRRARSDALSHRNSAPMSPYSAPGAAHASADLGASTDARSVCHRHFAHPPARRSGAEDHLQRPAEAAVGQAKCEQRLAAGTAHGSEISQPDIRPPANFSREYAIGEPCVGRPRPSAGCVPRPQTELHVARADRAGYTIELPGVKRAIAVHETHEVRACGEQSRIARRAEAAARLTDDLRPQRASHSCGVVPGAIVDHQRFVAGRHRRDHAGQRVLLVEHGKDHLDHGLRG